jgi:GAF domain-containing protein/HAMP domain-containing protein
MKADKDKDDWHKGRTFALTSIAVRLPLIFVGAILFITVTTGVAGSMLTRTRLTSLIQENLQTLAGLQSQQIEEQLRRHVLILESLSRRSIIQHQLTSANNVYSLMEGPEKVAAELRQRDEAWQRAIREDGVQSAAAVVLNIRLSEASRQVLIPESESLAANLGLVTTFLIVDRYGGLIAANHLPNNYYQGNEAWWQAVVAAEGLYLAAPHLNPTDPAEPVLEFAVPIRDEETGEMIGVLYSTYPYSAVKNVISQLQVGKTGRAALISEEGQVRYTVSSQDHLYQHVFSLPDLLGSLHTFTGEDGATYVMTAVPLTSSEPAIAGLRWYVGMVQDRSTVMRPVDDAVGPAILVAATAGLFIVLLVYFFYIRPLSADLHQLRQTAERLQEGALTRAKVERHDELGLLADTFNQMSERLRVQIETQDQIIAQRTAALRKQARQLEAVAHIGHAANSSLDLAALMTETVNLVRNSFGFYHISIFLIDEKNEYAIVRESTGEVGRLMKERGHKLAVGSESIVGWVTKHRQARIALDVGEDAVHFNNPLLPETRSEAALPLIAQDQMLGAIDVQSTDPSAFSPEDLATLQLMTDQLAAAIYNARLYRRATQSQLETETLFNLTALLTTTLDGHEIYRRAARTISEQVHANRCAISSWQPEGNSVTAEVEFVRPADNITAQGEYSAERKVNDLANQTGTLRVLQTLEPLLSRLDDPATDAGVRRLLQEAGQAYSLEVPLVTGNEAIGILTLYRSVEQSPFTRQEIRLVQAMANQTATALNNATLTSDARARVAELSTLYRISQALSLASDLKSVLDSARDEVMSLTNATGIGVRLLTADKKASQWIYLNEYGRAIPVNTLSAAPLEEGLSGYVARTGQTLVLNEIDEQILKQYNSRILAGGWSASFIGIPLKVANEIIGVLTVDNGDEPNAFTERDVQILTTIASSLAIAIQNQRLLEQMQDALVAQSEQSLRLRAVADISATVSAILDLEELLQTAVEQIQERFALYYVGIFLVDAGAGQAVLKVGTGEPGRRLVQQRYQIAVGSHSLIGRTTASGQPEIAQDVHQESNWQPNTLLPDTRSEMALPLRIRGRIIGALTVQSTAANEFTPELVSIFQSMGDQLASTIDGVRLLAETEARARRQQLLNEVSAQLHETADVDKIIQIGLAALSEQFNGQPLELHLGHTTQHNDRESVN